MEDCEQTANQQTMPSPTLDNSDMECSNNTDTDNQDNENDNSNGMCKRRKQESSKEEEKPEEEEHQTKDSLSEEEKEEKFKENTFPHTLEGFKYKFNEDGQLRDITDINEPFKFVIKPDDHYYNQKRYEALGEILNHHVYKLLETECNLTRITIPLDAAEGEPTSFVFASENALKTRGKLLILIHGSGVVRAGQWARRLIINDCLDTGTQIPYIKRAMKEGYEVLVLNTNENENEDGKEIRGSENPVKHGKYVFEKLLNIANDTKTHIAIVAHSYGGCVVLSLLDNKLLEKCVFAIALTDSVHQMSYQLSSPIHRGWLIQRARNWVSSDKELDTPLPLMSYKKDVERYSAGTTKHEETSSKAMESVFKFIKKKEPSKLKVDDKKAQTDTKGKQVSGASGKKDDSNMAQKDDSNTAQKDDSNTVQKDDNNTVQKDDSNTVQKDDSNAVQKDDIDRNTVKKDDRNTVKKDDSNTVQKDDSNTVQKDDSNTVQKDDSNTVQKDDNENTGDTTKKNGGKGGDTADKKGSDAAQREGDTTQGEGDTAQKDDDAAQKDDDDATQKGDDATITQKDGGRTA